MNPSGTFHLRRFTPQDAAGVVALVLAVWGPNYAHRVLCDAEALVRCNQNGQLVSIVALDERGVIVGHYALERFDPHLAIPETGAAMVHPDCRGGGLMNRLREAPTSSGNPKLLNTASRAITIMLCSGVLPKPTPGSSTIALRVMPARAAISSER